MQRLSTLSQHKHLTQGLGGLDSCSKLLRPLTCTTGLSPRLCCPSSPSQSHQEHDLLQEGTDTQRATPISASAEKLLLSPTFTSGAIVPSCYITRTGILKTVYLQTNRAYSSSPIQPFDLLPARSHRDADMGHRGLTDTDASGLVHQGSVHTGCLTLTS